MSRGLHVLVEKPMATSRSDADAMVRAAAANRVVLAVCVFRRLYPSTRLLRRLIDCGLLGAVRSFDVEEGEVYSWPTATLANMRRDLSGGGVLIDFGPHTLDRLLYLFPDASRVVDYQDNSAGGIESDCRLELELSQDERPVRGVVELSRTRMLRNSFRILCERGSFELKSNDRYRVTVRTHAQATAPEAAASFEVQSPGQLEDPSWYGAFRAQLDEWLDAIRVGRESELSGASSVGALALIEACYARTGQLKESWSEARLAPALKVSRRTPTGRVLVTGATGFIGGRTAEILHLREGWDVRALVHNPARASRLARLPVDMRLGDLSSAEGVQALVEGCDAVVHCAIGTAWGDRARIFDVTVEGTRRLAEAARRAGVQRFVHLTTWAVHDLSRPRTIDENTPADPPAGNDYAESKAAADRVIADAVRNGLPAVSLKLPNIYGPFSTIFTTRPITHLAKGELVLVGPAGEVPSGTVPVDGVVEAIVAALETTDRAALGRLFTISPGDAMSWADFYGYFAQALGRPLRVVTDEEAAAGRREANGKTLGWWLSSPWRGARDVARSPEMWGITKRVLKTDPIYSAAKYVLDKSPGTRRRAEHWLGMDAPPVYRPDTASSPSEDFPFDLTRSSIVGDEARRVLGYVPIDRATAMAETLEWLRFTRISPA
jgi:nucleoside-diphosphate-sugar epimerase/predicted dehydrogenase